MFNITSSSLKFRLLRIFLRLQRLEKNFPLQITELLPLLVAAVAVGGVSYFYAEAFHEASDLALRLYEIHPGFLFLSLPIALMISRWLTSRFAPEAGGSGIPQVMAAISSYEKGQLNNRLITLKTAGVKVLSSLVGVAGGGAIGREGPTIQIGAAVFRLINRLLEKFIGPRWSLREDVVIVTGSAAGLAAAFNTPIGGIVFAIEELTTKNFHEFKATTLLGVIFAGLTAQTLAGSYLFLGYPQLGTVGIIQVIQALAVSSVCGLGGTLFSIFLLKAMRWRDQFGSGKNTYRFVFLLGIFLAALAFISQGNSLGSGRHILEGTLLSDQKPDLATVIGRWVAPIATYAAGGAGGVFAPALSAGATLGAQVADLFGWSSVKLMAVCGMIAFLSALTQSPLTSFVLVLEMTDRKSAILAMMTASALGFLFSRALMRHSLYHVLKNRWCQ